MSQLSQEHFFLPGLIFIKGLKDFEQDFTPFQIQILSVFLLFVVYLMNQLIFLIWKIPIEIIERDSCKRTAQQTNSVPPRQIFFALS